jgi:hypothetical protein
MFTLTGAVWEILDLVVGVWSVVILSYALDSLIQQIIGWR